MGKIALVLASLACVTYSRRLQRSDDEAPLKALSDVLLAKNPTAAFQARPGGNPKRQLLTKRKENPVMGDELIQKFFSGGFKALEEEGKIEWWKSEKGWEKYMDEEFEASYRMNPRPSLEKNPYVDTTRSNDTFAIFKGGIVVLQKLAYDPWGSLFPDIEGDRSGTRSWGPGQSEITSRIITPVQKDMSLRTLEPGISILGAGRTADWKLTNGKWLEETFPGIFKRGGDTKMSAVDDLDADDILALQKMEVREMKANLGKFFEMNPEGLVVLEMERDKVDLFFDNSEDSSPPPNTARRGDVVMRPKSNFVPDMQRRTILNLITLGAVSVPVGWILFLYISVFIPPKDKGGGGGVTAKDAAGAEVTFENWLKANDANSRKLVQGIRGDATYLIVTADKKIEDYGLNAVCTHLGCVVPWNRGQNKFMCPCHGSQYNSEGKVVRGPAPLSLALAHITDVGGKVTFTPWTEQDFRTGLDPWWKP